MIYRLLPTKVHKSRRVTAHHLTEGQMVAIAGCRVMNVMGGITATCQHCQIGCWPLLGYSRPLLLHVGHRLMQGSSVQITPRVRIVPSGMFRVHQGEWDGVQLENQDSGTPEPPLSAHTVIERPARWPCASRPPVLCVPLPLLHLIDFV